MDNIKMDINFASTNSTFNNLDPYVLSSTKEEMDARKDLDDYQKNGAEEQSRKGSLRAISSAIQKQSNSPQYQLSTTNDCKCEWSHNLHSYPRGCSLLPLHDQLFSPKEPLHNQPSPPKEKSPEKEKGIHILETGEISFLAFRTTSSIDNYNSELRQSFNSNQCLLKVKPRNNYSHCVWCINFSPHREHKEEISFNPSREQPTHFSSEIKWRSDSKDRQVGIRELCGDECLDIFMSVQARSPNKVLNDINSLERNKVDMQELPSLSELVGTTKNKYGYRELQPKHEWLIDQENRKYFNNEYGITDINPLLEDYYGMSVLFLDSRGILLEWCEYTRDMYILGINEMEGFANILYHPEKRCIIIKDTGEIIPDEDLECQAEELAKAEFANILKTR